MHRRLGIVLWLVVLFPVVLGSSGAYAAPKQSCSPNPNLNAPPFVDNCPVPASTLNRLFQGAYGGLTPGVFPCATVTVNSAGYLQIIQTGTCGGGGGGMLLTGGGNILTGSSNLLTQ